MAVGSTLQCSLLRASSCNWASKVGRLLTLDGRDCGVSSAAFSADTKRLQTTSWDQTGGGVVGCLQRVPAQLGRS